MSQLFGSFIGRIVALGLFFAAGLAVFLYLYVGIGGFIPFVTSSEYRTSVDLADGDNLVTASRVSMAGVQVGEVRGIDRQGDHLNVTFMINKEYAPLHQGVHVRLGERSLVGESYFDVVDGQGPSLPSGSSVPAKDFQPSTQLHDVLASFDAKTRQDMSSMLRELGAGTEGTQKNVSDLMQGMGNLGRQGNTALDAISAQGKDLRGLGHDLSILLNSLDTSEGQIADMVTSADQLTKATSGQRPALEATVNELPGTLDRARDASADITRLSHALHPVAASLHEASPYLSDALDDLPDVTRDLRRLMPPLSSAIDRAPRTFDRVSTFRKDAGDTIPAAREFVRDLNPMLKYLRPYGPEIAAFFANFNAMDRYTDERGNQYLRAMVMLNDHSVGTPVAYKGPLTYENPFPKPGSQPNPGPWNGVYPHVERLPQ
jgi:phospholipid/cholesterol/gamma-HCH transport system substrate-binding protein